MANNNDNLSMYKNNSLNESISHLKHDLHPVIRIVQRSEINKKYPIIIKNYDQQNQNQNNQLLKKVNNLCLRKKSGNTKTILEYSFVEDHNSMKIDNPDKYTICKLILLINILVVYQKGVLGRKSFCDSNEKKRASQMIDEISMLKPSPGINLKSKKIILEKFKEEKPLYLRYQHELDLRKIKRENLIQNIFHQKSEFIIRSKSFNQTYFNEWRSNNQSWAQKTEAKKEFLKKSIIENADENAELIFKPIIDKTSELIVNMKNNYEKPDKPKYEELYNKREEKYKKFELKKTASLPSFTPKINKLYNYGYTTPPKRNSSFKTFYYEADGLQTPTNIYPFKAVSSPLKERLTNKSISFDRSYSLKKIEIKFKNKQKQDKNGMAYPYTLNVRDNSSWAPTINNVIISNCSPFKKDNSAIRNIK